VSKESNLFRALVHFFGLLFLALPCFGQVYRWVDQNGVTHYGERPPQGKSAREVQDRLGTPAAASPGPDMDWQAKDREFRARQLRAQTADEQKAREAAGRQQQCNQQRDSLARLRQSGRTYRLDEKGERIYLGDEDREALIARQERLVAANCSQ
jgi:hypothetical protein